MGSRDERKEEEPPEKEPALQCLEVDITEPLTTDEWANFHKVIEETEGMGWF